MESEQTLHESNNDKSDLALWIGFDENTKNDPFAKKP